MSGGRRMVPKLQLAYAIVERRLAGIGIKRWDELDAAESEARGSRRTDVEGPPVHGATPVCCHYHATGGALDIGCSGDQGPYLATFVYQLTDKGKAEAGNRRSDVYLEAEVLALVAYTVEDLVGGTTERAEEEARRRLREWGERE